jgi:oxygen-independent coproporphyrinogen-3 oxidase
MSETKNTTEVGNYFVANYPPFSVWSTEQVTDFNAMIQRQPSCDVDLGLYIHIPFCRKRCKFCYYRVYTDRNRNQRDLYLDALLEELKTYSQLPVIADRPLKFIYIGGGTPSALHETQIDRLSAGLKDIFSWEEVEEVTFECEPGTMTENKVAAVKRFGCTRLSLGVEHFDDHILEENGRAHLSPEIHSAYQWVQAHEFDQVNIDLIAGMVDETDATWQDCISKTIDMGPDSITIYQMELPYNTVYSRQIVDGTGQSRVADWETKRRWVSEAFHRLSEAGYHQGSAYTMIKTGSHSRFQYRDALWHGADLIAGGVASFGHLQGIHYQNLHDIDPYTEAASKGDLPVYRACVPTKRQKLIREMILQLKLGYIDIAPFIEKFGQNITEVWKDEFDDLVQRGLATITKDRIALSEEAVLQVDGLLPAFYEPEYRGTRYA